MCRACCPCVILARVLLNTARVTGPRSQVEFLTVLALVVDLAFLVWILGYKQFFSIQLKEKTKVMRLCVCVCVCV